MAQALSSTITALHEDLADELALLDNENTIFSSTVQSGGMAENSTYSRVADSQLSGRLGAVQEGDSVTRSSVTNQFTNRKKIWGIVQQKRENWGVSRRAQKVETPAGVNNLEGEARYRGLERYKQGKELTYLSSQVQNDNAYFYNEEAAIKQDHLTMGAAAWVSYVAQNTDSTYQVDSSFRTPTAQVINTSAATAFTEANLRTIISECRKAKRRNVKLTCFCSVDMANQFATFFDAGSTSGSVTPIRRFNQDGTSGQITSKLTGYTTAFGSMMVVPTEMLNGVRNAGALASISGTNTNTVTVTSTVGLQSGMKVTGTNIPADTYIESITNATTLVLNQATTGAPSAAVLGDLDHALFLEMEYFFEMLNGIEEVDLSLDGSGAQGYIEEFFSLYCSMPKVHGKATTIA